MNSKIKKFPSPPIQRQVGRGGYLMALIGDRMMMRIHDCYYAVEAITAVRARKAAKRCEPNGIGAHLAQMRIDKARQSLLAGYREG